MSIATKMTKAKKLGVVFAEDFVPKNEEQIDKLIEAKMAIVDQEKAEAKIQRDAEKKAAEAALKNKVILRDVDGDDVDQADYFFPRTVKQVINEKTPLEKVFEPTDQTAPLNFNKQCGNPVDREELVDVFLQFFPRKKGFLFYKARDREVYLIIVPLKYAKTISASNESQPGDFQRHALSFIQEGSVNIDSLKLKLERVSKHSSISTEEIAR